MRLAVVQIGYETDTAGVMLALRRIKPLRLRQAGILKCQGF
jgi:hypothetical protein